MSSTTCKVMERRTRVGFFLSVSRYLSSGVVQVSGIGPFLFVLHINDIVDLFGGGIVSKLYADDVNMYYTIDSGAGHSQLQ